MVSGKCFFKEIFWFPKINLFKKCVFFKQIFWFPKINPLKKSVFFAKNHFWSVKGGSQSPPAASAEWSKWDNRPFSELWKSYEFRFSGRSCLFLIRLFPETFVRQHESSWGMRPPSKPGKPREWVKVFMRYETTRGNVNVVQCYVIRWWYYNIWCFNTACSNLFRLLIWIAKSINPVSSHNHW